MKPKIQLSAHDVEFQRQERAKSNRIKKQLLIPHEKVPAIIKFKPLTFVLSPPKDIVLSKNNHSTSPPSNLEFPFFFPQMNLFSLSKTTPLVWGKETILLYIFHLLLPPSKSSPSLPSELSSSLSKSPSELKSSLKMLLLSSFVFSSSPTAEHAATTTGNHATAWTYFNVVLLDVGDAIVVSSRFDFCHFQFLPLLASSAILLSFVSTPMAICDLLKVIAKRLKRFLFP